MKVKYLLRWTMLLMGFVCFSSVYSQTKFTLSGSIKDKKNGELLTGATIYTKELAGVGAVANEYGYYSITLPKGQYTFFFGFIGYRNDSARVSLDKNVKN